MEEIVLTPVMLEMLRERGRGVRVGRVKIEVGDQGRSRRKSNKRSCNRLSKRSSKKNSNLHRDTGKGSHMR